MRVAFVRHVGPFKDVGAAWGSVMGWAGMRGLFGPHTRAIGVIHDDPDITAPEQLRYDASVTVLGDVRAEGNDRHQEIAAGDYAIARHRGPYDRISETYARMCGEWLPFERRELATAPALEFYLNAPQTTRPEDLLTDACLPLEGENLRYLSAASSPRRRLPWRLRRPSPSDTSCEAAHATFGIDQLLLTGIERMTIWSRFRHG
jgi:AraC family transcriptional regulator